MKSQALPGLRSLLTLLLLTLPATAPAEFIYVTNGGAITITGYTSSDGVVNVPATINDLPVTSIGNNAFWNLGIRSVSLPTGLTNIGSHGFYACYNLTNITIPGTVVTIGDTAFSYCTSLTSFTIPDRVTVIATNVFEHCSSLSGVRIGSGVTNIANGAFNWCGGLINVTLPGSLSNIESYAFYSCVNLHGLFFLGNAPALGSSVFASDNDLTVYYLPETIGWTNIFGGRPAVRWDPLVQTGDPGFGIHSDGFRLPITGATNIPIVVEAATSLNGGPWTVLQSLNLTNGSLAVDDANWTNYAQRFYRIRSP